MGRTLRIEFAGACYHVINRGNYRQDLFVTPGAAEAFLRVLEETAIRFGWVIHAYVLMSNHFHLAIELTEPAGALRGAVERVGLKVERRSGAQVVPS